MIGRMTAGFVLAASLAAGSAQAAVTVYELPFIGNWGDSYSTTDTSLTFTGNGFVGMYSDEFGALLGLEWRESSRTNAQVQIGDLMGAQITSAVLSFNLLEGDNGESEVVITGYAGNGSLGFQWDAPAENFGTATGAVSLGANAIDITSLLTAALDAETDWLNLHLWGNSSLYLWTYAGYTYDVDRAGLRLTVTWDRAQQPVDVPAPATFGLALLGLAGLGLARRRRAGR